MAKKKTGGGASIGKRSRKGATPTSRSKSKRVQMKKVPSKGDSDHGLEYYHTDEEGRTFDHHGRQVFREHKVQMVSNSGDEDDNLRVHPLEAGVFGVEGQDEGAEGTEDSNKIPLAEVARKKEGGIWIWWKDADKRQPK